MDQVRRLIRDVPDFPKPGIMFRDITPLLEDAAGLHRIITVLAERYQGKGITKIAGVESRGFILGSALAYALNCGLVLLRKPGKLPRPTYSASYSLEYGESTLHVHQDALGAKDRVVIVDDVIATGGTLKASVELVRRLGGTIHEVALVIELAALGGRKQLEGVPMHSLITY